MFQVEVNAKKLFTVPLSNNTVNRRIILEMASDILNQVDKSTDVSNAALLLVFVRYSWGGTLQEDMLFCGDLPNRTTAQECFRCLDEFFT